MIQFLYEYFIEPFSRYVFMERALLACLMISISGVPLGAFLVLRRMSLMGEAISHGVLPGIALSFLVWGAWLPGMTLGGLVAGLIVAFLSFLVARFTKLKEDASFASFYILALALGILVLSVQGGQMHIMHLLFGSILAVDGPALVFTTFVSILTIITLILIYRPLVYECFDSLFARSMGIPGAFYTAIFFILIVFNIVAACQALGTLMALGLIIIPAVTAQLLVSRMITFITLSVFLAVLASFFGLILSFHFDLPSGPMVILVCGLLYIVALLIVAFRFWRARAKTAR